MIPREDSNRSFGGPDGEFTSTHDDEGPEDLDDEDAKEQPMIAKKETKAVRRNKYLVMAVLAFSAIVVGLVTYFYIRNSEESKFEDDFESSAHKVLEAIGKSLEKTLKSLDSLTVAIVSHARDTNQQWPLVFVPDFALRASKIIALSDAVFLSLMPIVTTETRSAWEEFAVQQDGWLNQSVAMQADFDLYFGPLDLANGEVTSIWGDWGDIPYNVT